MGSRAFGRSMFIPKQEEDTFVNPQHIMIRKRKPERMGMSSKNKNVSYVGNIAEQRMRNDNVRGGNLARNPLNFN